MKLPTNPEIFGKIAQWITRLWGIYFRKFRQIFTSGP